MKITCTCENYVESMPQIESAQILAYTHGIKYTGDIFVYCPWCGVKLIISEVRGECK